MSAFTNKQHRTALIVDGDKYDAGNPFAERVNRLVESLNGDNIKVDIYSVRGGSVSGGVVFHGTGQPVAPGLTASSKSLDAVAADAKAHGYDLVIVAS